MSTFIWTQIEIWWHEAVSGVDKFCHLSNEAEDPLFILYTSGSAGKAKGVLHTTGGYLTYVSYSHQLIFDYKPGDILRTADLGWITGHHISFMDHFPIELLRLKEYQLSRFWTIWDVDDKHKVNQFYTQPRFVLL